MQLIFPSGLAYAVVRMDPVAMVKDLGLDDAETLNAVEAMTPKKYLVYLEYVSMFVFHITMLRRSNRKASRPSTPEKPLVSLLHESHRHYPPRRRPEERTIARYGRPYLA